jgi:hypothetical protein
MKKYKRKNINELFEMANISDKTSGIYTGIIQIRPENRHAYLPHIHYTHDIRKQNKSYAKILLSDKEEKIRIIDGKNIKVSNYEMEKIKEFILKNYKKLLDYYNKAEYIIDTKEFLNTLEKI